MTTFKNMAVALTLASVAMAANAGDFTPADGVRYSLKVKGSELVIGPSSANKAVQVAYNRSAHESYALRMESTDNGYYLINGNGQYLYYSGYSMSFTDYSADNEKAGSAGYTFDFSYDEANEAYRIQCTNRTGNNWVGADAIGAGNGVYSDKTYTLDKGKFELIESSSINYVPQLNAETATVEIEYAGGNGSGEGSAALRFTVNNYSGEVNLAIDNSAFTLSETSLTVAEGVSNSVTVSTEAAVGATAKVSISTPDDGVLGTIDVSVVEPRPRYYIVNVASGMVIGGDGTAVLSERAADPSQYFSMVAVEGKTDRYYLIQQSTGNYMKQVDSGNGVGTFLVEFGSNNKSQWQLPANGDYVALKNTSADRYLMSDGNKTAAGTKLYLYGLSSDASTKWEFIEVSNLSNGEPWIDITDRDVLVEKNGLTFTTQVRGMNIENKSVKIVPSDGVKVSLNTLTDGFDYKDLVISTSAEAGTECHVDFTIDDVVVESIPFTVQAKFPRYIIHAVNTSAGEDDEALAIGNEDDSLLPVLKTLNPRDASEHFMFIDRGNSEYYIVQDGTFRYFAKYEGDHWQTTLDSSSQRTWKIYDVDNTDYVVIRNTYNNRSLGVDAYEAGKRIAVDRSDSYWTLEAIGTITTDVDNIVLDGKSDSKQITVTGANLGDDITVVASTGFVVDQATLPATGGVITVSAAADGTSESGTIRFTSGLYSAQVSVRLKATEITITPESLAITGKNGSATFTVKANDWDDDINIAASEGFTTSITSIPAATSISSIVSVKYTGRTSATGTITITSGSKTFTIPVTATINSRIEVDATELTFDEYGSAYFKASGYDLYEPISITASDSQVILEPDTLDADADGEYVFASYPEGVTPKNTTITLTSGDINTKVIISADENGGLNSVNTAATAVIINGNSATVCNLAANAQVRAFDVAGRQVAMNGNTLTAPAHGIYFITVVTAKGKSMIKVAL